MERKQAGVTLIELMIAVAIVGILAAIAYPSYRNQVIRSTRTEGKVALEQRAQMLEKCFTRNMTYTGCTTLPPDGNTLDQHYQIATVVAGAGTTFTITATPLGSQAKDAECLVFSINQAGQRLVSVTGNQAKCW